MGVWGLGTEGRASVALLRRLDAEVVVVDDDPAATPLATADGDLDPLQVVATVTGGLDLLATCDVVVKAPGISRYRPEVRALFDAGISVTGGLALWMADGPLSRVIAVTGTKGKSTATAILAHILAGLGYCCHSGGNLGRPPWDPDGPGFGADGTDWWVVEVSSFQAADISVRPPVVAVTSLHPDHLDWHGGEERYYADKLSLCTRPGGRATVAADTPELRLHERLLGAPIAWAAEADADGWAETLGLPGTHNRRNAAVVRGCLRAIGEPAAAQAHRLAEAATGFAALPDRLELVARIGGVDFVNDSLATNVGPTIAALDAYAHRRVALLVGGFDRGLDYSPLAARLGRATRPTLVLTLPDNGPAIGHQLRTGLGANRIGDAGQVTVVDQPDLAAATTAAWTWAQPDGVVLLSPAAPSFGRYRNHTERAQGFLAAIGLCR